MTEPNMLKCIDIRKEKIKGGIITVYYVPTTEQTADILTLGLFKPMFAKLVDKLGMYNLYNPTWGGALRSLL